MFSATRKVTLGLVAGFLLSTVPAQEAQAFAPIAAFKNLTTTQQATIIAAIILTPYLMNFLCRKPLTTPRFDLEKLRKGSFTEKAKQLHYFFVDIILGWPRKDGKIKIVEDGAPGKYRQDINLGQDPAGFLGHTMDQAETAVKALGIPTKLVKNIALIGTSIMALTALSLNAKKDKTIYTVELGEKTIAGLVNGFLQIKA